MYKIPAPTRLSQSCLYTPGSDFSLSPGLHRFTPNYQLWSDGSNKSRWVYLPPGTRINTDDPDRWVFPLGTQFFKEFRKSIKAADGTLSELKVETRHLMKTGTGTGLDAWSITTYAWQRDQQDALLSDGASDVLNTGHNIPTNEDCIACHQGNIDGILGFDAIQLSDLQARHAFGHGPQRQADDWSLQNLLGAKLLTNPLAQPTLPGSALDQKMLGYLHANCGNCHNPLGHAAEQEAEHLKLRHQLSFDTLASTDVFRTAVNQPTRNFTAVPYIIMGAAQEEMALYQSAVFLRMNSIDSDYSMPMLARDKVDYMALDLLHRWMMTLPTPEEFDFNFDQGSPGSSTTSAAQTPDPAPLPALELPTSGSGLHLNIEFKNPAMVPPVMIVYWPEDKSLETQAMIDHRDGHFTQKLIVGKQGSTMRLRNSDEVGHTIYVKDKRRDIKWQLNYMPPGSEFEQELFWDEDVFVELRCRLHLYMSAWAGSINSRFYTVLRFKPGQTQLSARITDFPTQYTEVKVWMPRQALIHARVEAGQTRSFDLPGKATLTLHRLP